MFFHRVLQVSEDEISTLPFTQSTPGSAIHIRGITKQYPGSASPAVDAVDMEIKPGEFVVLLGPSGCGKTTLLKMINRISEPTSGLIEIDGHNIMDRSPAELRRQIGYVIQQTGLFPHMTIAANVAVVPKLLGWSRQQISDRVDELLTLVGLPPEDYSRRYPTQLSGGEQQRVGLARAIAVQPPTMLMDEPFGALDAITRTRLQDELRRIHREISQTVVFVTHDIDEALKLADRIAVMRDGKVEQYGIPLEIMQNPASDFVADLVGANDVLRRFTLIPAGDAMDKLPHEPADVPRIASSMYLREALSIMAGSGSPYLVVTDNDQPVGTLSFDSIQRAAMAKPE